MENHVQPVLRLNRIGVRENGIVLNVAESEMADVVELGFGNKIA